MRTATYIKSFLVAGLALFVLSGCSSGSSASGVGLGVSGFWSGQLFRNGSAYTNFSMNLVQILDSEDDPFSSSTIQGTFNASNDCISGGTIDGSLNSNNVLMEITLTSGVTLNMAGSASSGNSMSGSWSSSSGEAEEGEEARECNLSGTWSASR